MKYGNDMERVKCPMCEQTFMSGTKLNRHKRTCPEKE